MTKMTFFEKKSCYNSFIIKPYTNFATMKDRNDSYDRIIKYTGLFGGVQGFVTLITIVRTKLVTILLGPTGIGLNETYNRTLNLVKSITDLGLSFSAVKKISEYYDAEDTQQVNNTICMIRSWGLLTALFGFAVCIIFSQLFSLWAFDGDRGYTLAFILLSPIIAFSAINGCETAILKGTRNLKQIAIAQLITVILTLCISIPLFWRYKLMGLVPSLVLVSFMSLIVTCIYSFKLFPYRISFKRDILNNGIDTIKLGIYFTLASFFGAGAFSTIANYLMNYGNAEITGIYSTGYMFITYLGMFVFSAMDADYFPRLSTIHYSKEQINSLANSQIQVTSLLLSPMVVAFIVFLPIVVIVFTTSKFTDAIPMAQIAVLSLATKAMTQPAAYISLAKGDSKTFLLQEFLYDIVLVLAVIIGFNLGGLLYTGIALAIAGLFDWIMVWLITRKRYGFTATPLTYKVFFVQIPFIISALLVTKYTKGWLYWIIGFAILILSVIISVYYLNKHTSYLQIIFEKVKKKLKL